MDVCSISQGTHMWTNIGPDQKVQDASVQPIMYGSAAAADYRPVHVGAILEFSQCGTLTLSG